MVAVAAAAVANMLYIFYDVYKASEGSNILPITVHCDNDFETMALKHTLGVGLPIGSSRTTAGQGDTTARRLEGRNWDTREGNVDPDCGCPFMPNYMDMAKQSWDNTRKSSGSFLKTLYRFSEVLMGKDLFRPGEGFSLSNLRDQ